MTVDVLFSPKGVKPEDLRDSIVVVIDVLRAATTMATALKNGCAEIIPVENAEKAFALAATLPSRQVLIGGERHGRKVEGFHLGNSPAEYTEDAVSGKTIILTTTNGTRALLLSEKARQILVMALVNLQAVSDVLCRVTTDIVIFCSGTNGEPSLEDTVCAGLLVDRLQTMSAGKIILSGQAQTAMNLAGEHKADLPGMLKTSKHGAYLESIGFGGDLDLCARLDSIAVVPEYQNSSVRARSI
jgi:2-phosphosulfolactate phosphatase